VIYLTVEELVYIAERATGAAVVARDLGMLEAAAARPMSSWQGHDTYGSIEEKAAALVHSLVANHALVDGNQRLGLGGLIAFVGVNGWTVTWSNEEAYDVIVEIAEGRLATVAEIALRLKGALQPR
jgi:death-on-curing protein